MDLGGIGLHVGAFKKFVHFFRNSFFPVTKCGVFVDNPLVFVCLKIWSGGRATLDSPLSSLFGPLAYFD